MDTLLECLKNKMKKERRPLVSVEEIATVRERYSHKGGGRKRHAQLDEDDSALTRRVHMPAAEAVVGENDCSLSRHKDDIAREMNKAQPDLDVVIQKMKCTVSQRHDIDKISVAETLSTYPWLKNSKLLLAEAKLKFGVDFDSTVQARFPVIADKLMACMKERSLTSDLSAIIDTVYAITDDNCRKGAVTNAAVLLLPHFFRDRAKLMWVSDMDPTSMQPCIVLTGCVDSVLSPSKTSLLLDGLNIVQDDSLDISLAFSLFMAAYFVYGIQYTRKLRNTLTFMERFVFNVPSSDKIPYKVLRAASMLGCD